ncbi:MAG: MFS transporter [Gammaproteobacteria bacterium]|nr:MFS transporter [Gammaproteobacteria bacterium]
MTGRRILGIELARGISRTHLWAYFYAVLIASAYAGSLATLQPGVLQVMGVPFAEQGNLTGNLAAMQEVLFIVLLGLIGAISDKVGRKSVYIFGLLTTSLGFALYPTADSIAELVGYRIIIAIGSAAMLGMMVTVIADYSTNKTRGKANGVQGFIATLGAFIPPFLSALPAQFVARGYSELEAQQATFAVAALLGVSAAIIAFIGLAPRATQAAAAARESIARILIDGARASRDKGIALSYGAAFISRGDLAVTGAFLGLWLVQYGMQHQGMTPSEALASLLMPAILAVVSGALIGSILMGILADKISRAAAVPVASGLAAAVYMSIFFVDDPTLPWVKFLLFLMGVAEISAFVSSQALVGQQAEPQHRGAIMGFFGVAGAVGILIATKGGGMLFDNVGPSSPFVVFGALNLVVCLWGIAVHRSIRDPDWPDEAGD